MGNAKGLMALAAEVEEAHAETTFDFLAVQRGDLLFAVRAEGRDAVIFD